ncbi:MAG: ABC transporter permease [Clostridiales bacterium]|nr:ABC transporter permease [Clostridiales bacterium]
MKKYVLKRMGISLVTVFVILFVLFMLLSLMPGSPFNNQEKLSPEQIQQMKAFYGLDKPVLERFFRYIINMFHGDFGVSYNIQVNMPIRDMVTSRLLITLAIGLQAGVLGTLIGLILGIVAALYRRTVWDSLTTVISVLGVSLPSFVFALLLSYFLGFKYQLFPLLYNSSMPMVSTVLPTIALSMFTVASVARYTRTEMISVMDSDYYMLAESKGLPKVKLIVNHVLRNTMISVITVLAPLLVNLMTGSLVVEKIFSVPGLGSLYITAIQSNDYNVVLAISFIYSVMFIIAMLLVDILYGIIDPRIRLAKEE